MENEKNREYYIKEITEIINEVYDIWILEQIFKCTVNITKED